MPKKFRDPLDVFQPVWAAVGRVASAYGGVEIGLRTELEELLGETAQARVVANLLPTATRITLCKQLLREVAEFAPAEPLGTWILKACHRAGDERASIAHGSWHVMERKVGGFVGVRQPAKDGHPELRLSAEEIVTHANTIMSISFMLSQLGHMANEAIPASAYASPDDPLHHAHDQIVRAWKLEAFPF